MSSAEDRIVITGAAGLVGQNLILMLFERGFKNLAAIDKAKDNLDVLRRLNPGLDVVEADLAAPGAWADVFRGTKTLIQMHAQIGGEDYAPYEANNITATRHVLDAARAHGIEKIIHISSSVINSVVTDFYTETKKEQEKLVEASGIPYTTLRPTLMFGWFDRKHLGWLSRFMQKSPVFPVPGNGRYLRQPLYVRDFCAITIACLSRPADNRAYNITGLEKVDYIDIVRTIKRVTNARACILHIPYAIFWILLKLYALIDRNPPFTARQLEALVAPDEFEVIPWGELFSVSPTPFDQAISETFTHPDYATIALKF